MFYLVEEHNHVELEDVKSIQRDQSKTGIVSRCELEV